MVLDVLQGFYFAYFLMDLGPIQMASPQVFATSRDNSIGGGVTPCTESAMRLLIGHRSVVGLTHVVRRSMHLGCAFLWVSLLYRCMRQPRGSAPIGRDDVMAVSIRFSAMARDVSWAG